MTLALGKRRAVPGGSVAGAAVQEAHRQGLVVTAHSPTVNRPTGMPSMPVSTGWSMWFLVG